MHGGSLGTRTPILRVQAGDTAIVRGPHRHAGSLGSERGRHVGESNPFQLIDNQPAIPIASRGMELQGDRRDLHPRRLGHNQASWLLEDGHSPPSWNRTSIRRSSGSGTTIVLSVGRRSWSRRLESNQPNVLYPKQAAHLAPPPREYPGVELNHASDVRSVGSDPSTGALSLPRVSRAGIEPAFPE